VDQVWGEGHLVKESHYNWIRFRGSAHERLYIVLLDANPSQPRFDAYLAGHPDRPIPLEAIFDELLELIAERDPDFYTVENGVLRPV